jgi:hypothetical protein
MTKKNFLPMTMSDMPNVYKPTTSAIKMGSKSPWLTKLFTVLTFLSVIFGGTIMGFSFKTVSDNQVGYYANEPGYFSKGMYFQLPWAAVDMNIVDVGLNFLDFEKVMASDASGRDFFIQKLSVMYNVSDVDKYVSTLKNFKTKKYCDNEIEIAVLAEISKQLDRVVSNVSVPSCGISVVSLTFSTPVFGTFQKNDTYEITHAADPPSVIIVPITLTSTTSTTTPEPESLPASTTLEPEVVVTDVVTTVALPDVVIKDLDIKVSVNETTVVSNETTD